MNSKAIRKQLLAAVAMVLVAAVALGSSTYAWFVASGTVEAKGMVVKAQSDGNLVIRYKNTGNWGTTATTGVSTEVMMKPASTIDLDNWVTAQAADPMASTANLSTADDFVLPYDVQKDDSDTGYDTHKNEVMHKYFQIASASLEDAPKGLKIEEIWVNGTSSKAVDFKNNMSTALRVGVKTTYKDSTNKTKTTSFIFAPVDDNGQNRPTAKYAYLVKKGDAFFYSNDAEHITSTELNGRPAEFSVSNYQNVALVPADTPITNSESAVDVHIYIWFEGEDANLRSSNFAAENLDVVVKFTSIPAASGGAAAGA